MDRKTGVDGRAPALADDIIVTAGAQHAIALAVDALVAHVATISTFDATYPRRSSSSRRAVWRDRWFCG